MSDATKPCPICAEWRYISLVKICPICGAPGKSSELSSTAEAYLRRLEVQKLCEGGTFEEIWDSIIPATADPGHCFCMASP
jgi:hypothetical protein